MVLFVVVRDPIDYQRAECYNASQMNIDDEARQGSICRPAHVTSTDSLYPRLSAREATVGAIFFGDLGAF